MRLTSRPFTEIVSPMFYDDAHYLRATARLLRAIAAGSFDWPHLEGPEVPDQAADVYDNEAQTDTGDRGRIRSLG